MNCVFYLSIVKFRFRLRVKVRLRFNPYIMHVPSCFNKKEATNIVSQAVANIVLCV